MYSVLGHTAFEDLVMEARIICTVSSDTDLEDLVMEARIICTVSSDTLPSRTL